MDGVSTGRVATQRSRTNFSPTTTFSITTTFVSLLPLPMMDPLPMMQRLRPTFSPRLPYTVECRNESGEMKTPGGVLVAAADGGSSFKAYGSEYVSARPSDAPDTERDSRRGSSRSSPRRCSLGRTTHPTPSKARPCTHHQVP